jgi:arylsulfatase A-like enzyme
MGSTQPAVCVPSRAMLMSGRSLFRVNASLKDVPLLPAEFAKQGYDTYGIGKWHNGGPSFSRAFQNGKEIFLGGMSDHLKTTVHAFDANGKFDKKLARVGEKFSSELFADAAIEYLEGRRQPQERPFLLYVSFCAPHDPRMPPKEFAALYDPAKLPLPKSFLPQHPFNNGEMTVRDEQLAPWPRTPEVIRKHIAEYYGMISHLDAQVGRILDALEKTGHAKNTIIVFAGDNGLAVGRHGLLGKQSLYDHSVRVPLIFAGPGVPKGKKIDAMCYLFDVFPTLADLCKVKLPEDVEGKSLTSVMTDPMAKGRDTVFGAYRDVQRSIRTERWKLIVYPKINVVQLFDLRTDPDEMKDLSAAPEHAERMAELKRALVTHQKHFGDTLPLSSAKPEPKEIVLPLKKM